MLIFSCCYFCREQIRCDLKQICIFSFETKKIFLPKIKTIISDGKIDIFCDSFKNIEKEMIKNE